MKKVISVVLAACALTGCENLNDAWKATTDFVKGPVVVEAEGVYLGSELYSSGTGRCLSYYTDYSNIAHYQVSSCPKNLSVPYIVKDVSSISLNSISDFGGVKPKNLAYNADTSRAYYLELKPADDPMESHRISAVFTEKELKNRTAPVGFVKNDKVADLKEKDAQLAKQKKEKAEAEAKLKKERAEKEKAERAEKIAQCRAAYEAAVTKRKSIGDELVEIKGEVVDFASDGVMVMKGGNFGAIFNAMWPSDNVRIFVYTSDTYYATHETFKDGGYLYKRVGNYKYTTVAGGTNSIPAYKVTKYKKSEIEPKTYLADKSISCCYVDEKEFGVVISSSCYTESGVKGSYRHF